MKIDFNEEKHEYSVNGVKVPSVSEILSPLNADRYGDINPAVLRAAAEKGTAVHEMCEAIDYELDPEEVMPELQGYVDAYYQFLFDHEVEWVMVEQIVACYRGVEGEPPIYAGTIDRYGIVDGKAAVVDIKTYASMTTEAQMTASCQTALYRDAIFHSDASVSVGRKAGKSPFTITGADIDDDYIVVAPLPIAFIKNNPIHRYILHLKKDGKYRLIDLENFDEKRGWNGPSVAGELLHLYYEKQTALAGKRGKK